MALSVEQDILFRLASSKSGKIYLHQDVRLVIFNRPGLDTATAIQTGEGVDLRFVISYYIFCNIHQKVIHSAAEPSKVFTKENEKGRCWNHNDVSPGVKQPVGPKN